MTKWNQLKTWICAWSDRIASFLKRPAQTWAELPDEPEGVLIRQMVFLVIPSAAGRLLCWGYWGFGTALGQALLWGILLFALVWGTGHLVHLIVPVFGGEGPVTKAMQLSLNSYLPFLAGGVLYVNPMLGQWVPLFLIPGFLWLYHGLRTRYHLSGRSHILTTVITASVMLFGLLILGALTGGLAFDRGM
ncbi:hypothetical protein JW948_15290 [bacterium]|nr:hypothetical protein [bacterium]